MAQGACQDGTGPCVAIRIEVQNRRRAGGPFHRRTGKRLASREAQIVVDFRATPHGIVAAMNQPNQLVINLQPEDGLESHLLPAKGTGQHEPLAPVSLDRAWRGPARRAGRTGHA